MGLELRPSLGVGLKTIPLEDGRLEEASLLDGVQGLVNHLLGGVGWFPAWSKEVTFLEKSMRSSMGEGSNGVAWIPCGTP